jgi:thiol-disulfide isomerase/thioredoxin
LLADRHALLQSSISLRRFIYPLGWNARPKTRATTTMRREVISSQRRLFDGTSNAPYKSRVATQTAPAGRGFRIGRYRRDIIKDRAGAPYQRAIYQPAICSAQRTAHPEPGRLSGFQPITRRNLASLAAACALVGLATPAVAISAETAQGAAPAALKIWDGAGKPAFALDDLRGDRRDLQALAGKVVVVHFFATWCEPCVREIGSLQRLATATRDKPLAIVAIDVAEVDLRVRGFFETRPVDFTVLLDRDRAVSKAWDVTALPTSFVLDTTLTPRLFIEGDIDWSSPDVLAAIEPLYPRRTGTAGRPQHIDK